MRFDRPEEVWRACGTRIVTRTSAPAGRPPTTLRVGAAGDMASVACEPGWWRIAWPRQMQASARVSSGTIPRSSGTGALAPHLGRSSTRSGQFGRTTAIPCSTYGNLYNFFQELAPPGRERSLLQEAVLGPPGKLSPAGRIGPLQTATAQLRPSSISSAFRPLYGCQVFVCGYAGVHRGNELPESA
jgi:hypothetical protein